jgi:hypothetical protein
MLVNMIRANDKQEKKKKVEMEGKRAEKNFNLLPSVQSLISLRNISSRFSFVPATLQRA